ncbi:CAP domain-containing protein [Halovivax sp.]|uniref:CAP domain-containing protein n=1 Tax=Halovivax sp. TaxID=1935978 RepID=UPI0025BFA2F7|nr:CAP domain-containing protein [Halovivax sp.]
MNDSPGGDRGAGRAAASTDPSASSGPGATDRGLFGLVWGLLRLLFVLVLLAGLAIAGALLAPGLVDELVEERSPIETEDPPPTGDHDPEVTHPGDPGNGSYDGERATIETADVEAFVHHEVNEVRAEHDLEPIEWDGTVASVSRAHSVDMSERDYFAHTNPDGEDPMDRFREVADYCRGYGENIAMTWADREVQSDGGDTVGPYETAEAVAEGLVGQWMDSPDHREAILDEDWDRGGVGVYLTDDGQVFATHNFCTEW